MRQLNTNDVFKMSRILKKLELKIDADSFLNDKSKNSDEKFFIDIFQKILENMGNAQTEVNDFLGSLAGMSGKDFGELPIKDSLAIIKEFKELDGVVDFFKYASQLMK